MTGATGLYCGEQDLFCFLIDPAGWIEIGEEAFAPGFFVWNSEVGRRSLGISTILLTSFRNSMYFASSLLLDEAIKARSGGKILAAMLFSQLAAQHFPNRNPNPRNTVMFWLV